MAYFKQIEANRNAKTGSRILCQRANGKAIAVSWEGDVLFYLASGQKIIWSCSLIKTKANQSA